MKSVNVKYNCDILIVSAVAFVHILTEDKAQKYTPK